MLDPKSNVTAIVPAYNEEPTVGRIAQTLVQSGLFRDVIVISDGSTDRTAKVAKAAGASVHQSPKNIGKGAAMREGVELAQTPFIFFCDADLIGLRADHVRALIEPVRRGELDMCVGLRDRGKFFTWLEKFLPLIGGERVLRREIFLAIPKHYLQGFRAELAMNAYCQSHGLHIGTRNLPGLHIRHKTQKVGIWRGLIGYARMSGQLMHAALTIRLARLRREF